MVDIAQYHLGTLRCRREGASTPSGMTGRHFEPGSRTQLFGVSTGPFWSALFADCVLLLIVITYRCLPNYSYRGRRTSRPGCRFRLGRVARNKSFASAMPVASEPSQRSKHAEDGTEEEHVEGGAVGDPNPASALHQGALLLECRGIE